MTWAEDANGIRNAEALVVCVGNLRELYQAYGDGAFTKVLGVVRERLLGCGVAFDSIAQEGEFVVIDLRAMAVRYVTSPHQFNALLQRVRSEIAREPLEFGLYRSYLCVFLCAWSDRTGGKCFEIFRGLNFLTRARHSAMARMHDFRRKDLHSDMQAACGLLDELRAGHLILAFQPIMLLGKTGEAACLYSEALLRRLVPTTGRVYSWPNAIKALERLGWIGRLDSSVVWAVIRVLERYPFQRLGVNISAASLHKDVWWSVLLSYLEANPRIASRLTLEITETSSIVDYEYALSLTTNLQACGTQIALDDVGAGHTTLAFLSSVRANVVKIDRSILLRSREPQHSPDLLRNLTKMCADYSPCVVVEGIESKVELQAARYAGAKGVQGYWIEKPTIQPGWLHMQQHVLVVDAYAEVGGSAQEALFQMLPLDSAHLNAPCAATDSETSAQNTHADFTSAERALEQLGGAAC